MGKNLVSFKKKIFPDSTCINNTKITVCCNENLNSIEMRIDAGDKKMQIFLSFILVSFICLMIGL